jgi:hypothetical protein
MGAKSVNAQNAPLPDDLRTNSAQGTASQFRTNPSLRSKDEDTATPVDTDFDNAPKSPGDHDIGDQRLLKRRSETPVFTGMASFSPFYTSNVVLTKNNAKSDIFMLGTLAAAYTPQINDTLAASVYAQRQFFRYDKYDALDFNSINAGAGLAYQLPDQFWGMVTTLGYNYTELLRGTGSNDFYDSHQITLGFQKFFPFSKAHYLVLRNAWEVDVTNPIAAERNEYSLSAEYVAKLTRSFQVDASYKAAYLDYNVGSRQDFLNTFSLGLSFNPARYVSLGAQSIAAYNLSNTKPFDYTALSLGGGLTLKLAF